MIFLGKAEGSLKYEQAYGLKFRHSKGFRAQAQVVIAALAPGQEISADDVIRAVEDAYYKDQEIPPEGNSRAKAGLALAQLTRKGSLRREPVGRGVYRYFKR